MGAFFGALVFSARIGRRVVAAHVLHYGYLLRRLALLRLCCLNAHALAGLRSCGTATNGALLALSRGGALTFNARHALACLGAGALTALACGRVACTYVLVSILWHCNARHPLTALHVGALALDPRHALACACGSVLIPGRHVGHVAIGRVPLVCLGRLVRGNARMGNMIVAGTCIRRECG